MSRVPEPTEDALPKALVLIDEALDLLDADGSVNVIAAHLGLARARLAQHLGVETVPTDDEGLT